MNPTIPARMRLPEALHALGELRQTLKATAGPVVLDLSPLHDSDSSALAVLLALKREFGARLTLANAPARLRSLARLYGVEALILGAPRQECGT